MNSYDYMNSGSKIPGEGIMPFAGRHPQSGTLVRFRHPVPYIESWGLQQQLHAERLSGAGKDSLLLLEHQPVYTMGRRTESAHLGRGETALRLTGASVHAVNRGGSITYHGPGQLVGYPILQLADYAAGPKTYVRMLEEVLIRTLTCWGIKGYRVDRSPGVWVQDDQGEAKIAAIGVRLEQGITIHGFALNVNLDLTPFSLITPCGLAQSRTTSVANLLQSEISLERITDQVAETFSTVFNIAWTHITVDSMASRPC
jgi:lipoate-protein ligase B